MLVAGVNAWSQNVEAYAKLDSASIMIGDQIGLELGIHVPESFVVNWPVFNDTITSEIEIIDKQQIDTIVTSEGLTLTQKYTVTSFDSGYFELPSFLFQFRHKNDTTIYTANANALFLMVNTPVVDTSQAFKVIKGPIGEPYTFMEILPWILGGLGIVALILLLIWYLKRRKRNLPVFKKKAKPILPPDVLALQKLEELRLAKIWQQGRLKEYYTEVTDIIREYFEGRYHFDAMEMTSDEIIKQLSHYNINKEASSKIKSVLQLSDLVKFAKSVPTALENDLCLTHSVDFIRETIPVIVPDDDDGEKEEPPIKKEA